MTDVFRNLQKFLKLEEITIDNNIFKLHYKITGVLLIACSLLVSEKQYLGDPIDCITNAISSDMMDTYCWIHSTYTVTSLWNGTPGVNVAHPGVAPPNDNYSDSERRYHKYYQWVTVVLFFQALMFYVPRYLWKTWEGGKLKNLMMQLNIPVMDETVKNSREQILCDYYLKNLNSQNGYAYRFFFCEFLNLVNVILQIYITDAFLGGTFTTYGSRVVAFNQQKLGTRTDPMDEIFPKVTKCTFHKYGASGTIQRIDALCVLPINILNEKIYIILWFWFIILAILTGLGLINRLASLSPALRKKLLWTRAQLADRDMVENVVRMCEIGDWFVLYQLAKNMDPMVFAEVIEMLSEKSLESLSNSYHTADTLPSKRKLVAELKDE